MIFMSAELSGPSTRRFVLPTALAALLAVGALSAVWRAVVYERHQRERLLRKAVLAAGSIQPALLLRLQGDLSDLERPAYQAIKAQLSTIQAIYPECRFVYLMGRRDAPSGMVFHFADSEPQDSPDYSPPGDEYGEASEKLKRVFSTGLPITEGPLADRWGVWVSALAPVKDPVTGSVIAVLGLDIDARSWRRERWKAAAGPLLIVVLGALWVALAVRCPFFSPDKRLPGPFCVWCRKESRITAIVGIAATALAAHTAYLEGLHRARDRFEGEVEVRARDLQEFLMALSQYHLEGVARLFISSGFITGEEFRLYTQFLVQYPSVVSWVWIPYVADADRHAFESGVRGYFRSDYRIWEYDEAGNPIEARRRTYYLPACYVEPADRHAGLFGFDFASRPMVRDSFRAGSQKHAPFVLSPGSLSFGAFTSSVALIARALWNEGADSPYGYVAAALTGESMKRLLGAAKGGAEFFLIYVSDSRQLLPWARTAEEAGPMPPVNELLRMPEAFAVPAMDAGEGFLLVAVPKRSSFLSQAAKFAGVTGAVGLSLTALLSIIVYVVAGRRDQLEAMVASRTAELRASESSYRGLFNAIRQGIFVQERTGRFLDVNEGAVTMYGYSREELIGRSPECLSAPDRNDLNAIQQRMEAAWQGQTQSFTFWGRRKNGAVFPQETWLNKGHYFGREVLVAIAVDVSERYRMEEERARLEEQLQHAQKMESIGRLAGGVAHDFNNMLQAIVGFADLALLENKEPAVEVYLREIKLSAERSAELTRRLLAFASRQTIRPRRVELNVAVEASILMLNRLVGENVRLSWEPDPHAGVIRIDPSQINQILANLVVNARDALQGDGGSVTVRTGRVTCHTDSFPHPDSRRKLEAIRPLPGEYAYVAVEDTGCGMDESIMSRLFEPFFTTKQRGEGTGLGLATVFGMVKQNEGFISVFSAPGRGTSVFVGFPVVETDEPETGTAAAETPEAVRLVGKTVLLVEDEPAILKFGHECLSRAGMNVLAARTPAEAIEMSDRYTAPIDILLTDVVLPGMNGRELAEHLLRRRPDLVCVYMSGYTSDIIAAHGIVEENIVLIPKPFSAETLLKNLRRALRGQRARAKNGPKTP